MLVLVVVRSDQQRIGHHAERVDVHRGGELGVPVELLRRHVEQRAEDLRHGARRLGDDLGDPEIEHLDARGPVLPLREEEVPRLEIAVDDARPVGLLERERRLAKVPYHLGLREPPETLQALPEILAAEQLHHQERHPRGLVDPGVEDVDEVIALDRSGDRGLALEALALVPAREDVRVHHLEREATLGLEVQDLVHRTHSARSDQADDPVPTREDGPDLESCHVSGATWAGRGRAPAGRDPTGDRSLRPARRPRSPTAIGGVVCTPEDRARSRDPAAIPTGATLAEGSLRVASDAAQSTVRNGGT